MIAHIAATQLKDPANVKAAHLAKPAAQHHGSALGAPGPPQVKAQRRILLPS
jgi:hypothetical protein